MTSPVKLGLGVAGVGGTATSAYYGISYLVNEQATQPQNEVTMPDWTPLSDDQGFWDTANQSIATSEYKDKYAEKYARLLVGMGTTSANNASWWEWVFTKKYSEEGNIGQGIFRKEKVTQGSKGTGGNSLQEACDSAYKSAVEKAKGASSTSINNDEFNEEQFWKFCSVAGKKPKSIGEMTNTADQDKKNLDSGGKWNGKIGADNKNDLLAIHAQDNAEIWKQLDLQFKKPKPTTGFFSVAENGSDLKDFCSKAYEVSSTETALNQKPSDADLYKWCSLRGKKKSSSD